MSAHSNHQNQALTILTIATAAIGFGLFGSDFDTGTTLLEGGLSPTFARAKLGYGIVALGFYVTVLKSVREILMQSDNVTGRHIVEGPLSRMYAEMVFVALIFIVGAFEEPVPN
jgi:hypothetical protein